MRIETRTSRRAGLVAAGTLALALALSACSSDAPAASGTSAPGGVTAPGGSGTVAGTSGPAGSGTSAGPETVDQCSVLTASELQAALGVAPVGAGTPEQGLTGGFCLWHLPNSDSFTVGLVAHVNSDVAGRDFDGLLTSVHRGGTPVTGLGDKADFTTGNLGANFSDILVLTGRSILHLRHNAHGVPITQTKLAELAGTALD